MKFRVLAVAALSVSLGGCVTRSLLHEMEPLAATAAPAPEQPRIAWEVVGRNRLLGGELEEQRFRKLLGAYIEEYRAWYQDEKRVGPFPNVLDSDLLHTDKKSPELPANFQVRYDPRTGSYRCADEPGPACASAAGPHDWAADRVRRVRLTLEGAAGEACEWTVGGRVEPGPCRRHETSVLVDEPMAVSVRETASGASAREEVLVRDLRMVALGDSFSAGEGNPHSQWRYYGTRRKHPAFWLDARCHRSLMSGPALAAAYLAERNPHISVTLLHYGCSGASIADGLVTPWSLLETDEEIREQYEVFGITGEAFNALKVSRMVGARDVPRSQIEQAQADLTVAGETRRPDVVVVSIGGNDIGFASIVEALVQRWSTPPDLKAEAPEDHRPYASFDQAAWAAASRIRTCEGLDRVDCMKARVEERIAGGPGNTGENRHQTLVEQYALLRERLDALTGDDPSRVLITQYPNFVMREPDGVDADAATPEQAVGCVDLPLDKRAGFIPGLFSLVPGLGMRREVAERAEKGFLEPLNRTIEASARAAGWTVVSAHVRNARTHGYCSLKRYFNTLADSYWFQGRRYQVGRPAGNITLLKDSERFGLPKGTKVAWDEPRSCFVRFPSPDGACLVDRQPNAPLEELKRKMKPGQPAHEAVERGSRWGSTGPVHPNLFGHCNYAAAIAAKIVASPQFGRFAFAPELKGRVAPDGESGLTAQDVCAAETWGWRRRADPAG